MRRLEILLLGLLMIGECSFPPPLSLFHRIVEPEPDHRVQIRSRRVNMDTMYDHTRIPPAWLDAVIGVPYSNRRWTFVLLCYWETEWCRFCTSIHSSIFLRAHAYSY